MTQWRQDDEGDWFNLDLMTPTGHWHPELEQKVKEAIQRYPNMNAEWWLGPSSALSAVQKWLHDKEISR